MRHCEGETTSGATSRWRALGTGVVLRVSDPAALAEARRAVESELTASDATCSRFRADSDLSHLNAHAGRSTRVGALLMEALTVALRAAELTEGDVDPTIGRALELAGYDRDWSLLAHRSGVPDAERHQPRVTARALEGWRTVTIDPSTGVVRLPRGMKLDLGATAKAWAADRAAAAAFSATGCGVLVSVGGDIATSGTAPVGGWQIKVSDDHSAGPTAPGQLISIHSGGLATSSTAVRRWEHAGQTMHHIIDPQTGHPVQESWRTVSVAAASCTDANIATTAALVRADAASAWLAGLGLPARLLAWDGTVQSIAGWPEQEGTLDGALAA